jgi:CheY-like chemotaxis protein
VELRPGLIVMDLAMPRMNGLDAAREINRAMPTIAIILFSGYAHLQKLDMLLSAGISAVVDKEEASELIAVAHDLRNAA